MNSVQSVYDNFESFSDKDKKDILLYGDSRLTKNKFILEAAKIIRLPPPNKSSLQHNFLFFHHWGSSPHLLMVFGKPYFLSILGFTGTSKV